MAGIPKSDLLIHRANMKASKGIIEASDDAFNTGQLRAIPTAATPGAGVRGPEIELARMRGPMRPYTVNLIARESSNRDRSTAIIKFGGTGVQGEVEADFGLGDRIVINAAEIIVTAVNESLDAGELFRGAYITPGATDYAEFPTKTYYQLAASIAAGNAELLRRPKFANCVTPTHGSILTSDYTIELQDGTGSIIDVIPVTSGNRPGTCPLPGDCQLLNIVNGGASPNLVRARLIFGLAL